MQHGKGAMLVLAGPGSGKTAVITERVRFLVEKEKIPPQNILVITFSRAAAVHMKKRFENLTSYQYSSVNFGTFHAVFFNIIKHGSDYDNSSIISEEERYRFIRERIRAMHIETDRERDLIEQISSAISAVKGGSAQLKDLKPGGCENSDFEAIYRAYNNYLAGERKLDFDDMMVVCLRMFEKDPTCLKYWQEQYRYILIDEFQDINLLQYKLVRLLAVPENNIFAVGDDDQSIYGFRGARPDIMSQFEKDYRGCIRVLLDVNYRSHREITETAGRLVAHNKKRFAKDIRSSSGQGGICEYLRFGTMEEENRFVAERILEKRSSGKELLDVAVLFRMKQEASGLYRLLRSMNIPCRMGEAVPCVFDHMIAEDLISYMKFALNEHERADLLRVINRPNRYVTRQSIQAARMISLDALIEANRGKDYVCEKLEGLKRKLAFIARADVKTAIRFIRRAAGYDEWLKQYASEHSVGYEELLDIAGELEASAEGCERLSDWLSMIDEYRSSAKEKEPADGVNLMTFHRSKGLEFDTVFIIDLVEGSVPSNRAVTEDEIEEERRAMYVAMTRAKKELYILSSHERLGRMPGESRFIRDMGLKAGSLDGAENRGMEKSCLLG